MALEFYAKDGLVVTRADKLLRHVEGATYDIVAEVIGVFEEAWVLDCGLRLLRDADAPKGVRRGNVMGGRVYVGIDPFWYLEHVSSIAGAPELWYTARVDSIQLAVNPRSRSLEPSGQVLWSREGAVDPRYEELTVTNSSNDDDGNADYLLGVTLLSGPGV